jgi:hypothetical protein
LSGVIVDFDKLHKSIANDQYVSIAGDLMISRWAYEAMAVNQFKNIVRRPSYLKCRLYFQQIISIHRGCIYLYFNKS